MIDVSIIVPTTTGGFNHLVKLIPGLSQEPNAEIIIIDNASHDGTLNYLNNYDCLVKINKVKISFSESNNYGALKASSDYLLFLNNDTVINTGFTKEMIDAFKQDETIGIVGCLILTMENPSRVQHAGIMFNQDYLPYELGLPQPEISAGITKNDERVNSIREVPAVTAACLMIKKDIFNEVGGFDENYINGWEDVDLCLKVRELGYKIWYTGRSKINHLKFGSRAAGRFLNEANNRALFDKIWVHSGRAKKVLGSFREA